MKDGPQTPTEKPTGDLPSRRSNASQHIIAVEQKADLRQLNAEVLADAGYEVELAEDGVAAWTALQCRRYDLLITGQFLPKLSGVELLKRLHTARMTLPVIMATEILPTWEFALHPCLRAVTMLRRPYTMDKLVGLVKSVLPATAQVHALTGTETNWQCSSNQLRL